MPFVSYMLNTTSGFGWVEDARVFPLQHKAAPNLLTWLAQHPHAAAPTQLKLEQSLPLDEIEYRPVIEQPEKILCIGLNYHAHRVETGNVERAHPTVFCRYASCLVGHGQPAWRPRASAKMDFEGELAVIIGRPGRHIPADRAMEHVAGFACFNDISIRDWQRHTTQFTPGKNFTRTGCFGPHLVSREECANPYGRRLHTRLNNKVVQETTTDLMIFPIEQLIEYISAFTVLQVGDVISTGTPGGVGVKREPPLFMQPGDVVEVDIEGIGNLLNPIIDEPTDSAQVLK